MAKKQKFPQVIYAKYQYPERDIDSTPWLEASAKTGDLADLNDEVEVAVYRLERVRKLKNTSFLN